VQKTPSHGARGQRVGVQRERQRDRVLVNAVSGGNAGAVKGGNARQTDREQGADRNNRVSNGASFCSHSKINTMLKHFDREKMIWGAELPSNEKIFLLALNSFVDANGECYPGLELLSRMAGFTEKTARNVRDRLKVKGIITTGRRHSETGHRTSDRYRLDFDALKSLPVNFTSGKESQWKTEESLPVNQGEPTGKSGQNLPVTVTRDLPSKNYPERTDQSEKRKIAPSLLMNIGNQTPAEDMPWVLTMHRYNPTFNEGMLKSVQAYLKKIECASERGDAVNWLKVAFYTHEKGQERLGKAWTVWNEYQESLKSPAQESGSILDRLMAMNEARYAKG
jgi:hypothetical protein